LLKAVLFCCQRIWELLRRSGSCDKGFDRVFDLRASRAN
jgi:hypothetical protein